MDVGSEDSSPAPAPAPVPAPAPAPGGSPSKQTVLCSDVVLERVAGTSESESDVLSTTVVACNKQVRALMLSPDAVFFKIVYSQLHGFL